MKGQKQRHQRAGDPDAFGDVEDSPSSTIEHTIEDIGSIIAGS